MCSSWPGTCMRELAVCSHMNNIRVLNIHLIYFWNFDDIASMLIANNCRKIESIETNNVYRYQVSKDYKTIKWLNELHFPNLKHLTIDNLQSKFVDIPHITNNYHNLEVLSMSGYLSETNLTFWKNLGDAASHLSELKLKKFCLNDTHCVEEDVSSISTIFMPKIVCKLKNVQEFICHDAKYCLGSNVLQNITSNKLKVLKIGIYSNEFEKSWYGYQGVSMNELTSVNIQFGDCKHRVQGFKALKAVLEIIIPSAKHILNNTDSLCNVTLKPVTSNIETLVFENIHNTEQVSAIEFFKIMNTIQFNRLKTLRVSNDITFRKGINFVRLQSKSFEEFITVMEMFYHDYDTDNNGETESRFSDIIEHLTIYTKANIAPGNDF